jgi:hypothetical protein
VGSCGRARRRAIQEAASDSHADEMENSWRMTVEGMGGLIDAQSGKEGRYPIKQGAGSLGHNNTSPLYENPASVATLPRQSRRGREDYDVVVDVADVGPGGRDWSPFHTVTKGESGVSLWVRLTESSPRAHAAQGGVTLGWGQG